MQIIFSTFVVFQLFTACVSVRPKDVPGTRIFGSLSRQTLFPDASLQSCAGYSGSLCASDCRTLMICAGKAESIANITCPEYCSVNECSTQLPSACQSDSNFVCTSKGTFPDPNDCTKYHYCLYTGATSIDYQCQPEFAFNLQTKTCTFQAPCQTVNCASSENQWMQYDNANTGYYVYCGSPPLMFKCADADNYNFNMYPRKASNINCPEYCSVDSTSLSTSCQLDTNFICTSQGTFPDPCDCTKSHYCLYSGATSIVHQCPPDYVFNLKSKKCTYGATCEIVNCANSENQLIQYDSVNTGYYVYCGSPPIMFKCADADNYNYDVAIKTCVFDCPRSGSFVDVFDCTKYYSCKVGEYFYYVATFSCPENMYFNGFECVLGTCTTRNRVAAPALLEGWS